MKTTVISFMITVFALTANLFSVNAQSSSDFFFDRKYENGKVISSTKYELGYSGLHEKTHLTLYTYNDDGLMTQKETFNWNKRKEAWIPETQITQVYNRWDNTIIAELSVWNKKENKYNDVSEKAFYQLDGKGDVISLAFLKVNKKGIDDLVMNWIKEIKFLAM